MTHKTFEDYLKEVHAEDYIGTDDDMPDAFDEWLTSLQVDDLIAHAEAWHRKITEDIDGDLVDRLYEEEMDEKSVNS